MIRRRDFPRLNDDRYLVTSPATSDYNCIAWCANDTAHWWQPGVYWPNSPTNNDFGVGALEAAFQSLGYVNCGLDWSLEIECEKVALYGSGDFYTHAARQLPSGHWTSKLGRDVDIEHKTPGCLAGGIYGEVVQIMKRGTVRANAG